MKITKIIVEKLFGIFDHEVPITKDQVTIIHGPNGFGKTILLRMVYSLFNRNFLIFQRIPFSTFSIHFDDGNILSIRKELEKKGDQASEKIIITNNSTNEESNITAITRRNIPPMLRFIEENIPEIYRMGADQWINRNSNQIFSAIELIEQYEEILSQVFPDNEKVKLPQSLIELPNKLPVFFIKTDRLTVAKPKNHYRGQASFEGFTPSVVEHSQELVRTIRDTLAKSVQVSSRLDSSFPWRLIDEIPQGASSQVSEDQIRKELSEIEEKRQRLIDAGLLEKEAATLQMPSRSLDPLTLNALAIYSKDVKEKFAIYDDLLMKIEVFQKILNERFLYKSFKVSKNNGYSFLNKVGSVAPELLSSGEQHQMVLLYELLFRIKPSSFILIDEPEISLHIGWQHEFLKDLLEVAKVANFDALIATHSPDIINERWDLTVELKGAE